MPSKSSVDGPLSAILEHKAAAGKKLSPKLIKIEQLPSCHFTPYPQAGIIKT